MMKRALPAPEHQAFRNELLQLLNKHSGHLSSEVMLALASHSVGQMIALMDQRKFTPDLVMALVIANIEQGNAEALAPLQHPRGSA